MTAQSPNHWNAREFPFLFFFFFLIYFLKHLTILIIDFFLAALGLLVAHGPSLVVASWGYPLVVAAQASHCGACLVGAHRL